MKRTENIEGDKRHTWMTHLTWKPVFRRGRHAKIFMKDEIKMYHYQAVTDKVLCGGLLTHCSIYLLFVILLAPTKVSPRCKSHH